MSTHGLYCVGHITLDKVITPRNTVHIPGGTSFYFSHAIRHFDDIDHILAITLTESEMRMVEESRAKGIDVVVMLSKHIVYFENIYGENQSSHTQHVLARADPFTVEYLENTSSKVFHSGSLPADDFSLEVVKYLAGKGLVSIDLQGYLREIRDKDVFAVDWPEKEEVLKYVHSLKANGHEMEVLTGYTNAASVEKIIHDWGVKEALLAFESMGSIIYDGSALHKIPVYISKEVADAIEAGDIYMTGYLYKCTKGVSIEEVRRFAAVMTTLKVGGIDPFNGTKEDVLRRPGAAGQRMPEQSKIEN